MKLKIIEPKGEYEKTNYQCCSRTYTYSVLKSFESHDQMNKRAEKWMNDYSDKIKVIQIETVDFDIGDDFHTYHVKCIKIWYEILPVIKIDDLLEGDQTPLLMKK